MSYHPRNMQYKTVQNCEVTGDVRKLTQNLLDLDNPLLSTCDFGSVKWWNERYLEHSQEFDFYVEYSDVQQIIEKYCVKGRGRKSKSDESRILVVGAGNSSMSHLLVDDGYANIVNIDFSAAVVNRMKDKYFESSPNMTWQTMNCTDLSFGDNTFNYALDKGTMDSVLCSDEPNKNSECYALEMDRVLKDNDQSVWITISRGLPEEMLGYFENDDTESSGFHTFDCVVHAIIKPNVYGEENTFLKNCDDLYYVYVCRKNPQKIKAKAAKRNRVTF
uniref:Methyltransferase domain-containing protein n=1 Tax=Corethron hystrix TaxID=216773 RepID=A0A7S1FQ83_9STRA|mmetsp:Transcript_22304/g.51100  ORF Transcript_22304/g.51100 Transcript_22304/m.51100 type:complete len:275 (+) Transcript_22304:51-875(+)